MQSRRSRFRFSVRLLLLMMAVCTLLAWWVAHQRSEYFAEQRMLARMKQHAPDLCWDQNYYGPGWLARLGYLPAWLHRVDAIDVTGMIYGPNRGWDQSKPFPHSFDDEAMASIHPDLREFRRLRSLYLLMTKTTDKSLPLIDDYENLKFLNIQQTAMSSRAVKRLEQARPGLKVGFWHHIDQQGNPIPE